MTMERDLDAVEILLISKADPSNKDAQGLSALNIAIHCDHVEICQALLRHNSAEQLFHTPAPCRGATCLHQAAALGRARIAEALLAAGGDALLHAADARGRTCLHAACARGTPETVALLAAAGGAALLRRADAGGATCLHVAAARGDWPVAQAVLAAADASGPAGDTAALILAADGSGETCLHAASRAGHAAAAAGLAAAGGAGLLLVASTGQAATTLLRVIRPALARRADPDGVTCLMEAACRTAGGEETVTLTGSLNLGPGGPGRPAPAQPGHGAATRKAPGNPATRNVTVTVPVMPADRKLPAAGSRDAGHGPKLRSDSLAAPRPDRDSVAMNLELELRLRRSGSDSESS